MKTRLYNLLLWTILLTAGLLYIPFGILGVLKELLLDYLDVVARKLDRVKFVKTLANKYYESKYKVNKSVEE